MAKRTTKLDAKRAAYAEAMRQQPSENRAQMPSQNRKQSTARWVCHRWSEATDSLKTLLLPACWPDPGHEWHREGTLGEIEQRENADQRRLF